MPFIKGIRLFSCNIARFLYFKVAFCCFAAVNAISGFGQQISIPQPIPASPEASALAKYINYPVSYSTGLVNVSIPIYEIKVGDMTLPISLDYHSSGVKVNENSGWVGAGWSLQAEPGISRSIKGKADENGYLINTFTYPAYPSNGGVPYLMLMTDNGPEEEPDDFYYKLLGKSGGFHFKHTPRSAEPYQIVPHPFEPVKINYINSATWEITDDDGVKYRFGTSYDNVQYTENTTASGKTAWKGTEIISPVTKDTIHFSYVSSGYEYLGNVSDIAVVKDMANLETVPQDTTSCCHEPTVNYIKGGVGSCHGFIVNESPIATVSPTGCANSAGGGGGMNEISSEKITEIRFATGRVTFTRKANGALEYIKVYDRSNSLTRQVKLTVDYDNKGRYWLNKVEIMGSTGTIVETYSFEYHGGTNSLPVKSSRAIDFYGYHTSDYGANTLIRTLPISVVIPNVGVKTVYIGSGGRTSEASMMKYGTLSKITYPTGGYSTFEYDANKYMGDDGALVPVGGLRIHEIKDYDPVDGKTVTRNFIYGKNGSGAGFVRRKLGSATEDYMLETRYSYLRLGAEIGSMRVRTFYSNTLTDLFHAEDSPVVYDEVAEILKDSKTGKISGKTVYKYNHHDRSGDTWTLLPGSGQPTDPQVDWQWGQLISRADYSFVNNQYVLLQRKGSAYTTTYNPATVPVGKAYRRKTVIPTDNTETLPHEDIAYVAYNIRSGASRLTSDTLTVMNGAAKFVAITNYAYENPAHLYPTKIEHYGSDQVLQITVQKYPQDLTLTDSAEAARQNLITAWRLNNILEKTETKGAAITKTRTEYKIFTTNGPALPKLIYANTAAGNAEEIRLRFNKYDSYSNILSVTKENDVTTSYLWGYGHTLPIASVVNAPNGKIAYTSFETTTDKGNWSYSATPNSGFVKTGNYCYTLFTASPITKSLAAGTYKLEYWAKAAVTISGTGITVTDINTSAADVNGWILYQKKLVVSATATLQLSSTTNVQIDELRLYPIDAQMTTYTYTPLVGMTSVTDASNRTLSYNYDPYGRLSYIGDHNGHLIKTFVYHYAGKATTGVPFADVDFNYVLTNELQVKGVTSTAAVLSLPASSNRQTIAYLDGLGRPIQTVSTKSSPLGYDLIQPFAYDNWGREKKKFLPYVSTSTTGTYRSDATREKQGFYHGSAQYLFYQNALNVAHDTIPYALTIFEPSMLNRVLEQGSPGEAWKPDQTDSYTSEDHTVKYAYETYTSETSLTSVLRWIYTPPTSTYPFGLLNAGVGGISKHYEHHQLMMTKTKDEDGNEIIEYTNKDGQLILKRAGPNAYADTYYIYDNRDNLVAVIPPEATKIIKTTTEYFNQSDAVRDEFLKRWAFRYAYDTRQRMSKKQVPGAEPVYMVYDGRDRLVLTQDGNQRAQSIKVWTFTKYDAVNRPILTGTYEDSAGRNQESQQTDINNFYLTAAANGYAWFETRTGAGMHGYTNLSFPRLPATNDYLTVIYYDDYSFKSLIGNTTFDYNLNELTATSELPGQDPMYDRVTGQVTGTKTKNLGNSTWLWAVNYYDERNRVIQTNAANHSGGVDCVTQVYDWAGKVLRSKTTHRKAGAVNLSVTRRLTYDHAGRLLETWHAVGAQSEIRLTSNKYNELGQLTSKALFGASPFKPARVDPLLGQPGVVHDDAITSNQYDNKKAYVATESVRLLPGFSFSASATQNFRASIGYTRQEADEYNAANKVNNQVVDYRYNIRGWLSRINNPNLSPDNAQDPKDLFGMKLDYNEDPTSANYKCYNGNIRFAQYSLGLGLDYLYKQRRLNYVYGLNQIIRADADMSDGSSWPNEYAEYSSYYEYDLNGNITSLIREGGQYENGLIDNMTYSYGTGTTKSNRLLAVSDAGNSTKGFKDSSNAIDYGYDLNGNMTFDRNKGIDGAGTNVVSYNYLNLPQRVQKSATAYVDYTYDAAGRKLRQYVKDGAYEKTTDYIGEFFYENDTLKFIHHEEGRIVMTGATPEYQYNLKDHLGNVYLTFTTKPPAQIATATMENVNAEDEEEEFLYYEEAVKLNFPLFNHTPNTPTQYSTRLNGTTNERFGLAKSLSVMPGDTVRIEAFAKYLDSDSESWTVALENFMLSLPTAPEGTLVDGGLGGSTGGVVPPWINLISKGGASNTAPKAYLNYIIFDRDFQLIDGGFIQVGAEAKENGSGVAHQRLYKGDIIIRRPGYVRVYLSNENPTPVEVYFDDFSVMHVQSPVVQMDEYHPFGMTFNSYGRENIMPQDYKYNGKEVQTELDLGWLDYGARMYQPELGRFSSLDRFSEKYYPLTPYGYAANNPIKFIDVNGDSTYLVIYGAGYLNMRHATQDHDQGNNFEKNAQALKNKIEQREGFDPKRDQVIVAEARSTEQFTDATNMEYESGKIASLTVFSHGTESSISLGGEMNNDAQLQDYDLREININTVDQINKSNFEGNASVTLYGCNIGAGGVDSFAQTMSNTLGLPVKAFDGSAEAKTKNRDGKAPLVFDGTMIRTKDRRTQRVQLSTFTPK